MIHIMKLKEQYFDCIKNGTKEYEIRLNDEKRKNIKKEDFIEFQKEPYLEDRFIVKVDDLLYFDNFHELLNNININLLAPSFVSKEKLYSDLEEFYPIEKQNKYGVVAIKLRKNIIINNSNINNISLNNYIFNVLKNSYNNFNEWFNKLRLNNDRVFYTESNNAIQSILILKINEEDSQQFLEKGNILKIRAFLVNDTNKGIGTTYLELIDDIAFNNNIDYIYLTIKKNNNKLIRFMEKNDYKKYSNYNDEFVYYKDLNNIIK